MREAADRLLAATEARRVELGKRWRQVYEEAGLTHQTLNRWRKGHPVDPLTERALEEALLWGPGAREAITKGREPARREDAAARSGREAPTGSVLSPGQEVLRFVVSTVANGLDLGASDIEQVLNHVRHDMDQAKPPQLDLASMQTPTLAASTSTRSDLSDMVREARLAAGLSVADVTVRATESPSGAHRVTTEWLGRLEQNTLAPAEFPQYPELDALVHALHLDPGHVQEAAGVQFMNVHTVWSEDGQSRALISGDLSAKDHEKVQNLLRLYRRSPHQ